MTRPLRLAFGRLHRDQSGNIYVLYIAGALLLVAMLWAVIGVGSRLVQHETLQSSADATAYAGAVMRAKALNLIAFCNLLLAALFGLLVAQKLLYFALIAAGISATVIGGFEAQVQSAMDSVSRMERAVNAIYPTLALVEAARVGTHPQYQRNHGRGRLIAIAWPMPKHRLAVDPPPGDLGGLCSYANAVWASYIARISWPSPPSYGLLGTTAICDPDKTPPPLVLAPDFDATGRYVRGYSMLEDANVDARRAATSLAAREKDSSPTERFLLTTARAEVYSIGGEEDLWHMDWRARLVPFAPGDLSDRDADGALPAADINRVASAAERVQSLPGYRAFADGYLRH